MNTVIVESSCNPEILARIKTIIEKVLYVDDIEIQPTTTFENELGFDSIATIELIMMLEDEFDIAIPEEEEIEFETVGSLCAFLTEKLKPK
ncbi:acyl carrier protein [Vibrio splendidus]